MATDGIVPKAGPATPQDQVGPVHTLAEPGRVTPHPLFTAATTTLKLDRSMGRVGTLLLTLSGATPLASVLVIGSAVIAQAGTGAAGAFLIAAILCVPIALAYAELASAFPSAGAEYTFLGKVLGPSWAFMSLGINIVSGAMVQSVTALGLAEYLQRWIAPGHAQSTAVVAVVATTLIGVLNIRVNALITGLFLLVEIGAVFALIGLGLVHPSHSLSTFLHPTMVSAGHIAPTSLAAIGMGAAGAIYAYNGFGAASQFAEEMRDPTHGVASVILWSLAISVFCEGGVVLAIFVGSADLFALIHSPEPATSFMAQGGPLFSAAISLSVALAIVNAMIAVALQNARYLYAGGRDNAWPAQLNRAFRTIHPRFRSPYIATLAIGCISAAGCFLSLDFLVVLTGTSIVFIYLGVCLAAAVGRCTGATAQGKFRAPWSVWVFGVGIIGLAAILLADVFDREVGLPSLIANAIVLTFSAMYYQAYVKKKSAWHMTEPADEDR